MGCFNISHECHWVGTNFMNIVNYEHEDTVSVRFHHDEHFPLKGLRGKARQNMEDQIRIHNDIRNNLLMNGDGFIMQTEIPHK